MSEVNQTICLLCRHGKCGVNVYINDGKVVKVEDMPEHPNVGSRRLCEVGRASVDILNFPDRLKYPLKRVGERGEGKWERISWDEALDNIARNLEETKERYGAEAVDFHSTLTKPQGRYVMRLAEVFGTPNCSTVLHVCSSPRSAVKSLVYGGGTSPDASNARCIILWGANPADTHQFQARQMEEAIEKGAKLVVVDPRVTSHAKESDIHAQIRPGTDGALALGLLNVIIKEKLYDEDFVEKWTVGFKELKELVKEYSPEKTEEISWIPADKIRKIARLYAETKPACIITGNALDQNSNNSQAIRAVLILVAVTGNLDIVGGNVLTRGIPMPLLPLVEFPMKEKRLGANNFARFYTKAHVPQLWDAILKGEPYPIRAMFVMAANPMTLSANTNVVKEALKDLDFLAVADIMMSATAKLADIVLPAATYLEKTHVYAYIDVSFRKNTTPGLVMLGQKSVEPIGECWPDWKIIFELAKKLGYGEDFPWKSIEEAIDSRLMTMFHSYEELKENPPWIQLPYTSTGCKSYEKTGFKTPSNKVEIYSQRLEKMGLDPLPVYKEPAESPISQPQTAERFPFILMGGSKLPMYTHSQFHRIAKLREQMPENLMEINAEAAAKLGIRDGDMAIIESPRGSIKCRAKIWEGIDPRVVHIHHGFAEANVNVLIDHKNCDPITGSTGIRASLCNVRKA